MPVFIRREADYLFVEMEEFYELDQVGRSALVAMVREYLNAGRRVLGGTDGAIECVFSFDGVGLADGLPKVVSKPA